MSRVIPTSTAAQNIGRAEDTAHVSGDIGVFFLAVRNDNGVPVTGADGEYSQISVNNAGMLMVDISVPASANLQASILKREDDVFTSGESGVMMLSVRQDTPGNLSNTDGDYEPLQVSGGRLWCSTIITGTVTVATHAVTQSGTWILGANSGVDIGDITINNASGGSAVHIQDGGNSITIDAPVGTPVNVQIGDGANTATIRNLAANDALNVSIVDAAGDQITSFGGGTQYTEDAAAAANPVGSAQILVRQDTPAALVTTDGDNVARRGTNFGAAYTQIVTSSGAFVDTFGGGAIDTELPAAAALTDAFANPTAPAVGAFNMVYDGSTWVRVRGGATSGMTVDLGTNNDVTATNAGTFAVQESGAALTALQLIDNAISGAGFNISQINGVAPLMGSGATGTGSPRVTAATDSPEVTALQLIDNAISGAGFNITQLGGVNVTMGNGVSGTGVIRVTLASDSTGTVIATQATAANFNATVHGDVAHDSADSGNPQKIGGKARTTNPTAVADGDRADLTVDDVGRIVTQPLAPRDLYTSPTTTTITTTSETTVLAAGASGVFHDVYMLSIFNGSNTATRVDIRDSTAGTIRFSAPLGPQGGFILPLSAPLIQSTAAQNWTAQLSVAVTDVRVNIAAVKNV